MNNNNETTIVLSPGDIWLPRGNNPVVKDANEKCFHIWHSVTLFSSTVEECKKCGEIRGE